MDLSGRLYCPVEFTPERAAITVEYESRWSQGGSQHFDKRPVPRPCRYSNPALSIP